jgi:hypothetical protein
MNTADALIALNTAKQNIKNELIAKNIDVSNTPFTDYYLVIRGMQSVINFDDLTLFFSNGIRYNSSVLDILDTSASSIMNSMFRDFTTLSAITLNTDSCVFMNYIFYGCSALATIDLSNTENVVDFAFAFFGTAITTISIDTVNAQTLEQSFANCIELESITFTTLANCINFKGIFYNCVSLVTTGIDISTAEDIRQMYFGCQSIVEIEEFTPTLADSLSGVFQNCTALASIPVDIDCTAVTDINNAFNGCSSLLAVSLINCDNITVANGTFAGATALANLTLQGIKCNLNVSGCNLSDTAINALFGSLGNATNKVIDISNNPGSATCTTTIAELKGWTVVNAY